MVYNKSFLMAIELAHQDLDYQAVIKHIPYMEALGVELRTFGREVIFELPKESKHLGNPILPALHGGAIGGFMEASASLYLLMKLRLMYLPKIVDISIDYLRIGRLLPLYADCQVVRQGTRVVNVFIKSWQERRDMPVATARTHFLLMDKELEADQTDLKSQ